MPKLIDVTIDDCEVHEWHERDRDCAELRHIATQKTLVIFWDEDYQQAIEDGFLRPKHLKKDLFDYMREVLYGNLFMAVQSVEDLGDGEN